MLFEVCRSILDFLCHHIFLLVVAEISAIVSIESVFNTIRPNILVDLRSWVKDAYYFVENFSWLDQSEAEFILITVRPFFQRIPVSVEMGLINQIAFVFNQIDFSAFDDYEKNLRTSLGNIMLTFEISDFNFEFLTEPRFDLDSENPFGLIRRNEASVISILMTHFKQADGFEFSNISGAEFGAILEFAIYSHNMVTMDLGGSTVMEKLSSFFLEFISRIESEVSAEFLFTMKRVSTSLKFSTFAFIIEFSRSLSDLSFDVGLLWRNAAEFSYENFYITDDIYILSNDGTTLESGLAILETAILRSFEVETFDWSFVEGLKWSSFGITSAIDFDITFYRYFYENSGDLAMTSITWDLGVDLDSLSAQLGAIENIFFRHFIMFRQFFMQILVDQSLDANLLLRYQIIISNIFNSFDFIGAFETNSDITASVIAKFGDFAWFSTNFDLAAFDFDLYLSNVGYSVFSDFSECTLTCAAGSQTRTRNCRLFEGQSGVFGCAGVNTETEICNDFTCPIWADWKPWGQCVLEPCAEGALVTYGTEVRSRECGPKTETEFWVIGEANGDCPEADAEETENCFGTPEAGLVPCQYTEPGVWSVSDEEFLKV